MENEYVFVVDREGAVAGRKGSKEDINVEFDCIVIYPIVFDTTNLQGETKWKHWGVEDSEPIVINLCTSITVAYYDTYEELIANHFEAFV